MLRNLDKSAINNKQKQLVFEAYRNKK